MSKDKFSWTDLIPRLPGWITGFMDFISAVVGFVKLWQGDTGLVTVVLLVVGLGGGMAGCAYVAFSKTPPQIEGGRGVWRYPDAKRWAIAGLILIPLITISALGGWLYQRKLPLEKVIVLVARFDGPEPEKYRVTETLLSRLREATEQYEDVEIVALGEAITEEQGSTVARAAGERWKAAIVLWGWYGVTEEAVLLRVQFEVLREPKYMPEIGVEAKGLVRTMAVAGLESFDLQLELSGEMTYLTLFTVGMTRLAAGDYDGAISCFGDTLSQTSERVPALYQSIVYFYRGSVYAIKGDYDRAFQDFDRAVHLNPHYSEAYLGRGIAYVIKGDYDRAVQDFDQAIHLNPKEAEAYKAAAYKATAYLSRGLAYYYKGDYNRAIQDYDRAIQGYSQAIRLNPNEAEAYLGRGFVYVIKGDYDRAIADFEQAIRLNPNEAKPTEAAAYRGRGSVYVIKGDYDRAIADFNQAIQLMPDYAAAYGNRGFAYVNKGDYDRAIQDYDQAIYLNPDYAEAYYRRGLAFHHKARAHHNRGRAYADKGDYDHAIADYGQAIRLYNQAIADLQRFLELSNDPYWRQQAEQQLQELGAK